MTAFDWAGVWLRVAERIAAHEAAGRRHLLTEDVLRFETVLTLEAFGVTPDRLAVEVPAPVLTGGKLDLVVDGLTGTVLELKYPRDSRTGISPDTMTFGELLRDFLRVAAVHAADRWVVQLLSDRLTRYIDAACRRGGLHWSGVPGETVKLQAAALAALPRTATQAIGTAALNGLLTAECAAAEPAGDKLTLYVYRVAGVNASAAVSDAAGAAPPPPEDVEVPVPDVPSATRDGARQEILAAARGVIARSGRETFTMPEVIAEMRRLGTGYAESTIRTMMSPHLCAEATGPGVAGYADLTRVGHGMYRLTNE